MILTNTRRQAPDKVTQKQGKDTKMWNVKHILITAILFVAYFLTSDSVRASQQSAEKSTSTWDLIRQAQAKKAEPNKSNQSQKINTHIKEHVVHFPKDRSIGQLSIQDESIVQKIQSFYYWVEDSTEWESFAPAKGDVIVPAGKRLALYITTDYVSNVSALSKLLPDDLYRLSVSGSHPADTVQQPKPNDKCIPYITHLTGLKNLYLVHTAISAKGLQLLSNMKSLEYLYLSGELTDEGLGVVSQQFKTLKGLFIQENRLTDKGLTYLAVLSSLEVLEISSGRITNAGLANLAKLPSLRYLILEGTNFTDDAMAYLKDFSSLRILDAGALNSLTDADMVHIANIPNLEEINLCWSGDISDNGMAALARLASLKKLYIPHSKVTDKGLSYLRSCKNLEYLSLPYKEISDVGLTYIGQMSNLRHLSVGRAHYADPNRDVGYYTDKGVAELAKCKLLEELSISSLGITDESLRYIGELKNLEQLSIGDSSLTDVGMSQIAKLTKLKKLSLTYCSNVTNKGLEKLVTLKSLQNLYIMKTNITTGGLSSLNKLTNLTNLYLHDIRQDDAGMDISKLVKLEDLTLGTRGKRVGKDIVLEPLYNSDLACLANLNSLRRLQFGGVGIDDGGLKYLAGLKNLEFLNIGCPGESSITDAGVKYLTGLEKLDRLYIKDGHFTDKALEYLNGMPSLEWLELTSDVAFSNKGIKNFQAKNPKVEQLQLIP
jgi:internalin A